MDPDNLYFLRKDGLYSVVRTGGPARKVADMGGEFPCVGGDFVYWVGSVTPTTQAVVRASRFGSSVEKLFDLASPLQFSAIDGRMAWERAPDRTIFSARPGGEVSSLTMSRPDALIARPGGIYWANGEGDIIRLARDGSVSVFASRENGERLFDIDDEYAYGFVPPQLPPASDRYTWFRRPRGSGRDEEYQVEGTPVAAWSAGKRVLIGAGKQGKSGVQLSLHTPRTGSSIDLFAIDNYQPAVVDEWGIFWMDGSENIQTMTNTYRFYYYEFPLPS